MLNRRKFLKIFSLSGLALFFLPSLASKRSFSKEWENEDARHTVRNWLHGNPRRGCAAPNVDMRIRDISDFGIPPQFASYMNHEQYLS
jgi:hypothetical protein